MARFLQDLYKNSALRRTIFPILRQVNPGQITIKHHYTHQPFHLDFFYHRGYWYHGKKREFATMQTFSKLIHPGFKIIEIGAHIGYLTLYLAQLTGETGKVYAFEPSTNNLRYLKKNVGNLSNVKLYPLAVADMNGISSFNIDNLGGFTNTLVDDQHLLDNFSKMSASSNQYTKMDVTVVRLDDFLVQENFIPDLIKIDVEGAEYLVLKGMEKTLHSIRPILMIEIAYDIEVIYSLLQGHGYHLFSESLQLRSSPREIYGEANTFAFHKDFLLKYPNIVEMHNH